MSRCVLVAFTLLLREKLAFSSTDGYSWELSLSSFYSTSNIQTVNKYYNIQKRVTNTPRTCFYNWQANVYGIDETDLLMLLTYNSCVTIIKTIYVVL